VQPNDTDPLVTTLGGDADEREGQAVEGMGGVDDLNGVDGENG
jgi:hypothetical protein